MKRFFRNLILLLGIPFLVVLPSANARMGGFGGPGQGSVGHWGGGHFDHDHFHGRPGFFFVGAFPFWYPYYGSPYYYYYYDYPPTYYYDGYNYAPQYYYDSGPVVSYNDRAPVYPANDTRSYLVLGHDAGKGLRNKTVTWNWFVEYLQAYIVNGPSWVRDDFQRGFISGYGDGGESVFKKGIQQAGQRSVSSTENPPPSGPNSNSQRY